MKNPKVIISLEILFALSLLFIRMFSKSFSDNMAGFMLLISAITFYGLPVLGIMGIQKFRETEKTELTLSLLIVSLLCLVLFISLLVFSFFYRG